jgi:hypothetical protein
VASCCWLLLPSHRWARGAAVGHDSMTASQHVQCC